VTTEYARLQKNLSNKKYPKSNTVQNLKSFLGAVNFYRAKIPNFATIAAPLTSSCKESSLVSHLWFLIRKPTSHSTTWSLFCAITPPWHILGQTLTLCSFLTLQISAVVLPSCSPLTRHCVQTRFSLKLLSCTMQVLHVFQRPSWIVPCCQTLSSLLWGQSWHYDVLWSWTSCESFLFQQPTRQRKTMSSPKWDPLALHELEVHRRMWQCRGWRTESHWNQLYFSACR